MRGLTIRWRLTLWYGGMLCLSFAAVGIVVYFAYGRNLIHEIDRALDEELTELVQEVEGSPDENRMLAGLEKDFGHHAFYMIQAVNDRGVVIFRSDRETSDTLPIPAMEMVTDRRHTAEVRIDGTPYRVASRLARGPNGVVIVQAGESLALYRAGLRELTVVLCSVLPLVMGLALAGGYLISRRALAPVDRIVTAAKAITATNLDRRVEIVNPDDELGRLAGTLNEMIARLEKSFEEMRRFTADAAHELRTPLAVLRSEAEVTLRSLRSPETYRHVLENQLEEIDRLTRLADQLLFLCREDAGLRPSPSEPTRLDRVLEELADDFFVAAQEKEIVLTVDPLPAITVQSHPDRLRRLFVNLLDNAVKYTRAGGQVVVRGVCAEGRGVVLINDTGIGIPAEHRTRVFERFYRVDAARNGETPGAGLGLAICRAIVEADRGTIELISRSGEGTEVRVELPLTGSAPLQKPEPAELLAG